MMVEFTSEPQRTFRPITFIISLVVLAVALGALFLYVRYQKETQSSAGASNIVVKGLLRPGNTNFEYYKTRIRIENVKASLGISFNQARIAIISGLIVNDGDRKLDALELRIILYDVWGKVSKERTAFALRPGAGYSGKPMGPLEERPFTIGVEAIEYYWNPKQVTYEITGLRYQ